MSHHSSEPDEREAAMREAMKEVFGEFPDGKLNKNDAGGIVFAVESKDGRVVITYPKPVAWVGMTADEAIGFAELLVKYARKCGSTKPLQLHIG